MNYDLLIADLKKMNRKEQIYREYHSLRSDPRKREDFKKTLDYAYIMDQMVILPEIFPESIPPEEAYSESKLFPDSRNVTLRKHDRYTPATFHYHSFFELTYVLSGQCTHIIRDQRYLLKEGELCFLSLNTSHAIEVYDDSIVINILLRHNTFLDIFLNTLRHKNVLSAFFLTNLSEENLCTHVIFPSAGDETLRNQILDMYLEEMENDEYCDNILVHRISVFFSQLMRTYSRTARLVGTENRDFRQELDIVGYIENNYRTVTLSDVAEHFHYTDAYCSRLIHELTGKTFVSLLREVRLTRADFLLANTNISIENLADTLGYSNPETLIRIYRKYRNMTPGQYRKLNSTV